jgi:hypothetical protein
MRSGVTIVAAMVLLKDVATNCEGPAVIASQPATAGRVPMVQVIPLVEMASTALL